MTYNDLSPGDVCVYHQPGKARVTLSADGNGEVYQPGDMLLMLKFVWMKIHDPGADDPLFVEFLRLSDNRRVRWHPWVVNKHLKKLENA